jgi:hypothetical protein
MLGRPLEPTKIQNLLRLLPLQTDRLGQGNAVSLSLPLSLSPSLPPRQRCCRTVTVTHLAWAPTDAPWHANLASHHLRKSLTSRSRWPVLILRWRLLSLPGTNWLQVGGAPTTTKLCKYCFTFPTTAPPPQGPHFYYKCYAYQHVLNLHICCICC